MFCNFILVFEIIFKKHEHIFWKLFMNSISNSIFYNTAGNSVSRWTCTAARIKKHAHARRIRNSCRRCSGNARAVNRKGFGSLCVGRTFVIPILTVKWFLRFVKHASVKPTAMHTQTVNRFLCDRPWNKHIRINYSALSECRWKKSIIDKVRTVQMILYGRQKKKKPARSVCIVIVCESYQRSKRLKIITWLFFF